MTISEISIKNHVFAWMLMAALIIFGGISFTKMGVSQLPNVDSPVVNVSISLPGAAPEIMELTVVDTVEDALTGVQGIKSMSSSSRTGNANISVEFDLSKDVDVAVQEIQTAITRIQRRLPAGIEPPSIRKSNPDNQPIIVLSVSSDKMPPTDLMKLVRYDIQDRFTTVPGVGDIMVWGFAEPNLRVWLDKKKMANLQLTASDIINTINKEHDEQPGGRVETADKELNIRTRGEAETVEDFGEITINTRGGRPNYVPVALKDVAKIEKGTEDIRSVSRAEGKFAVGIGIMKQPGMNSVEVGDEVKKRMKEIAASLPEGVEIGVRFDLTTFISESIKELYFTLILAALLTSLVCWLFLGSWTATLNIILAIPTSIIGTFMALYALGYTLNTFTLLGLSLAIGIVVDDAIMVLENIVRHREKGQARAPAALNGSKEITFAAIAATAAIIAIFLPVAFMEGVIGRYFLQFGVTLSVAVLFSLLEALTLTPMRCSRFLTVEERSTRLGKGVDNAFKKGAELYKKMIPSTLNRPYLTIIAATLFFAVTVFVGVKELKREMMPSQDQSRLILGLRTPVGSSLSLMDEKTKEVEKYLKGKSEVESIFASVGGGSSVNSASIMINMVPKVKRKISSQKFMKVIREETKTIKGVRITIQDPSLSFSAGGRGGGKPVSFSIRGPEWEKLVEYSEKMMEEMEKTKKMVDIDTNYQSGMPELEIIPDRIKARDRGVDVSEISDTVNIMMAGAAVGKYSDSGRRYDIRVGLSSSERSSVESIKSLLVRNNRGELIPLSDVVKINQKKGLQAIFREDRQRAISVNANVAQGSSQQEAIDEMRKIAKNVLPAGYLSVPTDSTKTYGESFLGLYIAMFLGILVAYMVLASQFNSFSQPVTILVALPFSVSGAFIGLYLFGLTLNIFSMIGLILLMGIVKKNSILLVEFTNQMRAQGLPVREALIAACPIRLRPILMTSLATIAAAIPSALAFGPGAETRIPMSIAVIFGVLISTVLTLFIVPSFYMILERWFPSEIRSKKLKVDKV
ncbi:MAG: acriflavin resistance protein [Candidatus Firestonebacteria bacterium RIFOXYC2_FULL_39_67]|nr:MAG: acriflavin resistance protein [Candidatus Firestonebacteria bacterium RIFOXYD2_FULL_39_29]OGF55280.1 MAG: acriflavin resistance protein [Candidatus Firestonebacteria bacterium RIFOXYC2_FULL_39_67]OGF57730.1 MAG: acriflavin resistance protein [Candidatus Firestonebacteria bacterium RifOxyC12_full_39_7]